MVKITDAKAPQGASELRSEYFRTRLLSERRRLQKRLASWITETSADVRARAADELDVASDLAAIENSCRIGTVESDIVRQIDLALEKIESGAHGLCEACGAKIPFGRLHSLPFVSMCVPCQERHERGRSGRSRASLRWEGPFEAAAEGPDPSSAVTLMSRDRVQWWDR
jgi:DnaK suppressor protein